MVVQGETTTLKLCELSLICGLNKEDKLFFFIMDCAAFYVKKIYCSIWNPVCVLAGNDIRIAMTHLGIRWN